MSVFSLPTQRCFLTTQAEYARMLTFLCLRRGVSGYQKLIQDASLFSLPTQRCFLIPCNP